MVKYIVTTGAATFLLLATLVILVLKDDRTGPIISFTNTDFAYTAGEPMDMLLKNVKAEDDKDGDVTDSILVADILPMLDHKAVKVIYVAKDSNHNISEKEIIIPYSEENGETGTQSADINGEQTLQNRNTGTTPYTNTDAAQEVLKQEGAATPAEEPISYPYIELTTHEVRVKKGSEFQYLDYVKQVKDDKDREKEIRKRIKIVGSYDLSKKGDYVILYYTTDKEKQESNKEYLWIKVY